MKVKVREIVDAMAAMAAFAQKELPAKAAYRVAKLVRKMNAEFQHVTEAKNGVIRKYGKPVDGKAGQYQLDRDHSAEANKELEALLDAEVDLEGCMPVAWADVAGLQLAPAVLADLEVFIEAPPET